MPQSPKWLEEKGLLQHQLLRGKVTQKLIFEEFFTKLSPNNFLPQIHPQYWPQGGDFHFDIYEMKSKSNNRSRHCRDFVVTAGETEEKKEFVGL